MPARSIHYDSAIRDYSVDESLNRMEYFSNSVMEDSYDAAVRSRSRDQALLRDANATIRRPSSRASSCSSNYRETETGHPSKRFLSVPPRRESRSPSVSMEVVPYNKPDSLPSPSSFLSNRVHKYLPTLNSPPAPSKHESTISYSSLLPDPVSVSSLSAPSSCRSYRSYISDPLTTRSSSYRCYLPSSQSSYNRTPSRYTRYGEEDDVYTPISYRTTYRSLSRPRAITYDDDDTYSSYHPSRSLSRARPITYGDEDDDVFANYRRSLSTPRALTYGSDRYDSSSRYRSNWSRPRPITYGDEEEDYTPRYSRYTSSSPRSSGNSYVRLSSYEGPYDGSYEADMAEMYDYVPFGPSTHGILELTASDGDDSSTRTLPARKYSPIDRYSPIPDRQSRLSSPLRQEGNSLAKPSARDSSVIRSLVSNTAAKAKEVLANSKLPYKNAHLVLSVEGAGVSEDGENKYGFKYFPPPIPLTGGPIGLDERILGITPLQNTPADSFLGGYLERLRNMHSQDREVTGSGRRGSNASVASTRPSAVAKPTPSYSYREIRMPLTLGGNRESSVPVSSYRSRLDDGQSHRVDVLPLYETEASVPANKVQLPMYNAKGEANTKLTLLDRISIKAAIIGSRVESDDGSRRPRSQYAANKLRELKIQDLERYK